MNDMSGQGAPGPATRARAYRPLLELTLARLREAYRQPETLFWVYGFPLLMATALGIAFRSQPVERFLVDVQAEDVASRPRAEEVAAALRTDERFQATVSSPRESRVRLRVGKADLVVVPQTGSEGGFEYRFDPTQPRSELARRAADDRLQRWLGREDAAPSRSVQVTERGSRYIDFLTPGLLGMSLLGGGMWGVGFTIVDMRIRKLLKRLIATPMKRSQFLGAMLLSRLVFLAPEMGALLLFTRFAFGVVNYGNWLALIFLLVLGALTFAGLGLLIASRAKTLETASGLMNLAILPMWILSGIFFSPDRFPSFVQPIIAVLPLTPLISALRQVMLEGASLFSLWREVGILTVWLVGSFVLALRWFRWN